MTAESPELPGAPSGDGLPRAAAGHTPDALFVLDPDGTVTWANPAAHHLLGSPPEALPGQNLYARLTQEELALALQGLALVDLGLPTRPAVYHPTTDDGSTRPAEVIARAMPTGQIVVSARPAPHAQWVLDELSLLVGGGPVDGVVARALAEVVTPWPGHVATVVMRDLRNPGPEAESRVIGDVPPEVAAAIAAIPRGPWHAAVAAHHPVAADTEKVTGGDWTSPLHRFRRCLAVPLPTDAPEACLVLWERNDAPIAMRTFWRRSPAIMLLSAALRQEQLLRDLRDAAATDRLTGLLNRAGLEEAILGIDAETVGVVAVDLDGFKAINDTHGHRAGDDVLVAVAARLREAVRTDDVTARVGGDELLALCAGAQLSDLSTIADRFLQSLTEPVAVRVPAGSTGPTVDLQVTASVGLGLGERADLDALLGAVDLALYRAKRAGGARWSTTDL